MIFGIYNVFKKTPVFLLHLVTFWSESSPRFDYHNQVSSSRHGERDPFRILVFIN